MPSAASGSAEVAVDPGLSEEEAKDFRGEMESRVRTANLPVSVLPQVWDIALAGRRCIVALKKPDERTEGGIWIPPTAQRPTATGWIVNIGPDFARYPFHDERTSGLRDLVDQPLDLIAKKAIFGQFVGQEISFFTTDQSFHMDYLIVQEWEIWGIDDAGLSEG